MDVISIPESLQQQICGTEEIFPGSIVVQDNSAICERNGVFFRDTVCPGLDRLMLVREGSAYGSIFGYYDRNRNRLDYYSIGNMKGIQSSLSFQVGEEGPMAYGKEQHFAVELLQPLFFDNGDLNEDELSLLSTKFHQKTIGKDIVLPYARLLQKEPDAKFFSIICTHSGAMIDHIMRGSRLPMLTLDEIAKLHFLEGTEDWFTLRGQIISKLLCEGNGFYGSQLLYLWNAFRQTKQKLAELMEDDYKKVEDFMWKIRGLHDLKLDAEVAVHTNDGCFNVSCEDFILNTNPLGIFFKKHATRTMMYYFWSEVKCIKKGNKILWR